MTVYNPNIPIGTTPLDVDYQNIQQNFQQLDTTYGKNHVAFSTVSNNGRHKFVELPVTTLGAITPSLITGEATLYSATKPLVTGSAELHYTRGVTGVEIQLTGPGTPAASTALPNASSQGTTFLPGGIVFKWGNGTVSSGTNNVTFTTPFPNSVFSVVVTRQQNSSSSTSYGVSPPLITGFDFTVSSSSATPFFWMAIGN